MALFDAKLISDVTENWVTVVYNSPRILELNLSPKQPLLLFLAVLQIHASNLELKLTIL